MLDILTLLTDAVALGGSALIDDRDLLSDPFNAVLDIIRTVEALPACNKVASAALLHSCSGLDESATSSDRDNAGINDLLEESKSIYATRLAVCELLEAANAVPDACSAFVPTKKTTRKRGFKGIFGAKETSQPVVHYQDYDEATERDLKRCTVALGSKPQWWTSYSNARQNAVVMCHATRAQVEKGTLHV